MARVQLGQGAVRSDRAPDGVLALALRPLSSPVETGRSWNAGRRPEIECSPVPESVGRRRHPQCAQKLWFESRSLVRPQLAQRATGFVLTRKSSGTEGSAMRRLLAKLPQTPLRSNPLPSLTGYTS
jgi:hypothetical protein